MSKLLKLFPGLMFTALLTWVSFYLQNMQILARMHVSSLILAIILGIIFRNSLKLPEVMQEGTRFAAKKVLRLAIILLGFKLSFLQVAQIGGKGLIFVTVVSALTMFFAIWLGRQMGIDERLALVIGAGTSICGASAVAAVGPVVKADEKDTTFALATVTLFGTIVMFACPIFYRLLHLPEIFYAVWTGASIHEVAQVVAAGFAAGEKAGEFATLVKLTRVLLLIPLVIILSVWQVKKEGEGSIQWRKITIPWFVFGFLATVILNSTQWLPVAWTKNLVTIDGFLLTLAMAGLGLETSFAKMKKVGLKPFYFGFITSIFISILGFLLAKLFFA